MKKQTLEQKILSQLITKYTIEKQSNKRWWIIYSNFELVCETYSRKNADRIRSLLSFDSKQQEGESVE